jgi:hypothetical protein
MYHHSLTQEASVHKSRPLPVENRPLRRVMDRFIAPNSLFLCLGDEKPILSTKEEQSQWRDEMVLDLLNLEATVARIQLLRQSNARERDRYTLEKNRILQRASTIKNDTADLKVRLEGTQNTMAARREYDELADKITSNRMLKPREDQIAALEKLSGEISELEQESLEYKRTWAERRDQFGRIVEEGKQMLRLIKDEKEEAERKEGMQGGQEDEHDGIGTRALPSGAQTPHSTMAVEGVEQDDSDLLRPPTTNIGTVSKSGSRAPTPSVRAATEDIEMGEVAESPAVTHLTSELEEGEAEED